MSTSGPQQYMRCLVSKARTAPVRTGTYSPILQIDGSMPCRTAIIVDSWGASRTVCEDEDGRWQLFIQDHGSVAELVFA
jgi:hypothetical protein